MPLGHELHLLAVRAPTHVAEHSGANEKRDIHRNAGVTEWNLKREIQSEHKQQQRGNNHS